jgi:hypothetical protein
MRRVWVFVAGLLLVSGCASSTLASNASSPRDAAPDLVTGALSSLAAVGSELPTPFELPASPVIASPSSPASAPAQCPASNQPPQPAGSTGALVGAPTSVRLCGFAGSAPMNGRPIGGVVLGAGPATALIAALSSAASASPASATCNGRMPTVLMQFSFAEGPQVDVPVMTYGCAQEAAFVAGTPRVIDTDLSDIIVADAGSYLLTGTPTPNLYGQSVSEAETTATRAGNSVDFGGQLFDPDAAAGTVVLQNPPAGAGPGGPGGTIDVILAAPVAPDCRTAQLAIDYYGGGLAGGGDFGSIRLRNITAQPCALRGSVGLVGTDKAGHAVTRTLTYPTQQPVVLTANALRVPDGQAPPLGETDALLMLGATYTNAGGACVGDEVAPATWRLSFPDGTLTVPNTSNDPEGDGFASLLTCGGHLDNADPIREG